MSGLVDEQEVEEHDQEEQGGQEQEVEKPEEQAVAVLAPTSCHSVHTSDVNCCSFSRTGLLATVTAPTTPATPHSGPLLVVRGGLGLMHDLTPSALAVQ